MSDFYYTVDWYVVEKHKRSGKILREGWQSNAGPYDTLEEAKADNPPNKYRYRFCKKYFEVLEIQEAAE